MADVSKDDVQAIVRDAVRDLKSEFSSMRDQVQRVDKRTDDLMNRNTKSASCLSKLNTSIQS